MTRTADAISTTSDAATKLSAVNWQKVAMLYVRIALAAAFLSAVGARFGMYGKDVGWGNFANFTKYTAEVNSFMPAWSIPYIAWIATAAEVFFALALLAGIWPRWIALGTALLLAMFGTAMAISFGSSRRWIIRSFRRRPLHSCSR